MVTSNSSYFLLLSQYLG